MKCEDILRMEMQGVTSAYNKANKTIFFIRHSNSKVAEDGRIKDYKTAVQQIRLDCDPDDGKFWQE